MKRKIVKTAVIAVFVIVIAVGVFLGNNTEVFLIE